MRIFIFFSNIFSAFVRLFEANVGKVRILLTYFSDASALFFCAHCQVACGEICVTVYFFGY